MAKVPIWVLKQRQGLPLEGKIFLSKTRINNWYNRYNGKVYISFSGGKDSTVLLHLVRGLHPEVPAVFVDTGLEYPEVREFVKGIENVIWLKPKLNFKGVIKTYGYPIISKENAQKIEEIRTTKSEKLKNKRLYGDEKGNGKLPEKWKPLINAPFKISSRCCTIMKKEPFKQYEKESKRVPFIGTMASDSVGRRTSLLRLGCNNATLKRPRSLPIAFFLEKDIWEYIEKFNLSYSKIYDMGYHNTGCIFCGFGAHLEKPNKFELLKETHPALYQYCMERLGLREVLDFAKIKKG